MSAALAEDPVLGDASLARAIEFLTRGIEFPGKEFFQGRITAAEPARAEAVTALAEIRKAHPDSVAAHAAHAFALEIAGKAMSATAEIAACCERFPGCWEMDLFRRREWLWVANPLKLPPFDHRVDRIDPAINKTLLSNLVLLTREQCAPKAVLFLKDAHGDLDRPELAACRITFTTMMSPVSSPQLVAVMGRIYDNPENPYNVEIVDMPFRPNPHQQRTAYEFFVRQDAFDLVIVDGAGRVLHTRRVRIGDRMAAAHREIAQRFEKDPGREVSLEELGQAIRAHQAQVDQTRVTY